MKKIAMMNLFSLLSKSRIRSRLKKAKLLMRTLMIITSKRRLSIKKALFDERKLSLFQALETAALRLVEGSPQKSE
jgi:hypothetical protein